MTSTATAILDRMEWIRYHSASTMMWLNKNAHPRIIVSTRKVVNHPDSTQPMPPWALRGIHDYMARKLPVEYSLVDLPALPVFGKGQKVELEGIGNGNWREADAPAAGGAAKKRKRAAPTAGGAEEAPKHARHHE